MSGVDDSVKFDREWSSQTMRLSFSLLSKTHCDHSVPLAVFCELDPPAPPLKAQCCVDSANGVYWRQ